MDTSSFIEPQKNIYPGSYTPAQDLDQVSNDMANEIEDAREIPSINCKDYPDHFILEVPLPAIPRENISVSVNNEIVRLMIKDTGVNITGLHPNKPTCCGYACHNIRLGDHIQTGFISASYRNGLLNIYIPKSTTPSIDKQEVAVY